MENRSDWRWTWFGAILAIGLTAPREVVAQNFNGTIGYELTSTRIPEPDTLTYFFSDEAVVKKHVKGLVEKHDHAFTVWLLKEGRQFGYYQKKKTWEETQFDSIPRVKTLAFDSLQTNKQVDGFYCDQYLYKTSASSPYGEIGLMSQLWVARELNFELPPAAASVFSDQIFNNPARKIVLFEERMPDVSTTAPVFTLVADLTEIRSQLRAVSVSHELPLLFFEVVRACRENRAVRE